MLCSVFFLSEASFLFFFFLLSRIEYFLMLFLSFAVSRQLECVQCAFCNIYEEKVEYHDWKIHFIHIFSTFAPVIFCSFWLLLLLLRSFSFEID